MTISSNFSHDRFSFFSRSTFPLIRLDGRCNCSDPRISSVCPLEPAGKSQERHTETPQLGMLATRGESGIVLVRVRGTRGANVRTTCVGGSVLLNFTLAKSQSRLTPTRAASERPSSPWLVFASPLGRCRASPLLLLLLRNEFAPLSDIASPSFTFSPQPTPTFLSSSSFPYPPHSI